MSFKTELKKRFNDRCVLTGGKYHEANHIVPRSVCHHLGLTHLMTDSNNGLLLTPTLHREYDKFEWSFDIHNVVLDSHDTDWCWISVVICPYKSGLLINNYNKTIKVLVKSLPFLWINYQVFLSYNFEGVQKDSELLNEYMQFLSTIEYQRMLENPLLLMNLNQLYYANCQLVIGHRNYSGELLVIDRTRSWTEQKWISEELVADEIKECYLQRIEEASDQSWIPSSYLKAQIKQNAAEIIVNRVQTRLQSPF